MENKNGFIGKEIIFKEEVSSTNDLCKEFGLKNYPEGLLVVANKQLSGRGRQQKFWSSLDDVGIYMSLLLRPKILPTNISKITLIAGLAILETLEKITGCDLAIKWPNDIIFNNKKVSGILTENFFVDSSNFFVVCGIRINVNNHFFDEEIKNMATSLFLETQKNFEKEKIISTFLEIFEKKYLLFLENDFAYFLEQYKNKCITLNKDIRVIKNSEEYFAKAIDILQDGSIYVKYKNGMTENIFSGDVSVRGILGYN